VEQIEVTKFLDGQTLRQLDLRATAGLNVMGIRQNTPDGIKRIYPDPGRKMALGEVLIVMGKQKDLESFRKAIGG
jgi:Trk K+ transport system NAD-binding subunit